MRPGPNSRRTRGRNNNPGGGGGRRPNLPNRNQTFDSNGPDVRIRGNAYQVHEKYLALARDAAASGDRIMAENYLQHAEHYYRIINAINEAYTQAQQQPFDGGRDGGGRGDQVGRDFGGRGDYGARDNGQRVFDPRDEVGQESDFGADPRQSDERESRDTGTNGTQVSDLLPGEARTAEATSGEGEGAQGERPARRRRNPGSRPRRGAANGADSGETAAEAAPDRDQPEIGS